MKRTLNPEGKLLSLIGLLGDHMMLGILWLFCSLPLVTCGAAGAALCRVSFLELRGESNKLLKDFFGAFRALFKKATLLSLAVVVVGLLVLLDGWFYVQVAPDGMLGTVVLGMLGMVCVLYIACLIWLFPALELYGGGVMETIKMGFILAMSHFGWTGLMLAGDFALLVLSLYIPFMSPFSPGVITLLNTWCIRRALGKHRAKEASPETEE